MKYIREWCIAGLIIFISFYPDTVSDKVGIIINSVLSAVIIITVGFSLRRLRSCDWLVILFFTGSLISLLFAQDRVVALRMLGRFFISPVLIWFLCRDLQDFQCRRILMLFYAAATLLCLYGIIELVAGKNFLYLSGGVKNIFYGGSWFFRKVFLTLYHPTVAGNYLSASLPLALIWYPHVRPKGLKIKVLFFTSVVLQLGIIIFTVKMAWVVFVFLSGLVVYKITRNRKKTVFSLVLILVLLAVLVAPVMRYGMARGFESVSQSKRARNTLSAFAIFRGYPLFGIGFNNFRNISSRYSNKLTKGNLNRVPDNQYLAFLAEGGVVVFIPFMVFAAVLLHRICAIVRRAKFPFDNGGFGVALSVLGMLMYNTGYDALYWYVPMVLFWVLSSILMNKYCDIQ